MKRLPAALAVAVLVWAAVDAQLTWAARDYRPQTLALSWQAVALWGALAIAIAPAAWHLARRSGAKLASALVCLALPVMLHQAVRDALRTGTVFTATTFWRLAVVAFALLIIGIAVGRLERRLAARGRGGRLGLGLSLLALVALLPGLTGGAEAPAGRQARHESNAARPNLLLLVWDTTRADGVGAYGAPDGLTPHLDAFAEQSAVFENAWSSSLFTLSSHASLLTGLPPTAHGTSLRRQAVRATTLPTRLKRANYRTGAFVGTSVLTGGNGLERDFDVYDDLVDPPVCDTRAWDLVKDVQSALSRKWPLFRNNGLPHAFNDFQRPAGEVLQRAWEFISADDPRPWFVMINLFDVHWPYTPGDDARSAWVPDYDGPLDGYLFRSDDYPAGYTPDDADKHFVRGLYDAEMWELDAGVDAFLSRIDLERGDVTVVMTSDHGEGLGEGGLWSHDELVTPQTRVPLMVYAPGRVEPGRRDGGHVSGTDVAPTLLALARVTLPPGEIMAGHALLDAGLDAERLVFVQDHDNPDPRKDGDAVLSGRFRLVSRFGERRLYDVQADPLNEHDIAAEHPSVVARLGAALDTLLAASAEGEDGPLQNFDALRALGYTGDGASNEPPDGPGGDDEPSPDGR